MIPQLSTSLMVNTIFKSINYYLGKTMAPRDPGLTSGWAAGRGDEYDIATISIIN